MSVHRYGGLFKIDSFTRACSTVQCEQIADFRTKFRLPSSSNISKWFPQHMSVQMKVMEGKLRTIDCVVEVHDARIPITGRNPKFIKTFFQARPHILVMNKMDLIDLSKYKQPVEDYYRNVGISNLIWTNCQNRVSRPIRAVINRIIELIRNEPRFNRIVKTEYQVMVIGVPNVGKSALINALRATVLGRKTACMEGQRPGVTLRVQNRVRISDNPPVYILDTPGVLTPQMHACTETVMKMALCNLILDTGIGFELIADYLLFWLNSTGVNTEYRDFCGLNHPTDDVRHLLWQICTKYQLSKTVTLSGESPRKVWDMELAARKFVALYQKNRLADVCLDKMQLLCQ